LKLPLDTDLTEIRDLPYTISFVIRKRMQIDSINEIPKEKRPPELMLWDGDSEEIESWINKAFDGKQKQKLEFTISPDEIG